MVRGRPAPGQGSGLRPWAPAGPSARLGSEPAAPDSAPFGRWKGWAARSTPGVLAGATTSSTGAPGGEPSSRGAGAEPRIRAARPEPSAAEPGPGEATAGPGRAHLPEPGTGTASSN